MDYIEHYLNFVCPRCYHSLDECKCEGINHWLLHIDRNLQQHIRILRRKDYRSVSCCESHIDRNSNELYIGFSKDYDFGGALPLPEGFRYQKKHLKLVVSYSKNLSVEEREAMKQKNLSDLLEWCKNLPDNRQQ